MGRTVCIDRVINISNAIKWIRMSLPVCVCVCVYIYIYIYIYIVQGAVQKIGRSLIRFQLVSLGFFIYIKSFRSHYGPGVSTQPLTEMSTRSNS